MIEINHPAQMNEPQKNLDKALQATLLIEIEKSVLEAFKNKDDYAFTKSFAIDYTGVANNGIKNTKEEVAGMHTLDLEELWMEDEKVLFPATDIATITYKMMVKGSMKGKNISGSIYCSSVYVQRENKWLTVLHTESISQ